MAILPTGPRPIRRTIPRDPTKPLSKKEAFIAKYGSGPMEKASRASGTKRRPMRNSAPYTPYGQMGPTKASQQNPFTRIRKRKIY